MTYQFINSVSLLLYYLCYHQSLGLIRHSTSNLQSFQSLSPESQSSLLYARASLFPFCRCLLPFCPSLQHWAEHRRNRKGLKLLQQLSVAPSPSFFTWWLWLGQHHAHSWGQAHVLSRSCWKTSAAKTMSSLWFYLLGLASTSEPKSVVWTSFAISHNINF